ncbi:MAG: tRNA (adenosine(37)-N6)-dimethylallyltransferase MiaA [Clostridia bacterium]|nr:tRNA (adenosine(37)-N6)-dimethylallyltransferase MiaA [Clostridia bacterium]
MDKPKIICVVGPTASGKTSFAISLAKKIDGEIVSCDSMQIYKYMNIGTAKPTPDEMQGIPHHMLDFVEPSVSYSVADFAEDARKCINDILSRGKTPILCGGTGLYIDSIINQIEFSEEKVDMTYRNELQTLAEKEGVEAVHKLLQETDPIAADKIHPNNLKRVIRALEIQKTTGLTKTQADKMAISEPLYDAEIFGMEMDREQLYERINLRVDLMIEAGLLEEVENLLKRGIPKNATAMQAIGYKEFIAYFDGKSTLEDAIDTVKRESRRYAKRQLTWFKRNKNIRWLSPTEDISDLINE